MSTVAPDKLLTAEEFRCLPNEGRRRELVRGRVVEMNVPTPRHGQICTKIIRILGRYLDDHDIGHLISNDAGVPTAHDPDTVRGVDVGFFSYGRLPPGPLPEGYLEAIPELVFEVRSPTDRWVRIVAKAAEYLNAGVSFVCILDPATRTAHVYGADQPTRVFGPDQEWPLPEVLGEFRTPVRAFFE
jgi:Uma2 family endonuclease